MTEPNIYPPELVAALREALETSAVLDPRSRPADDDYVPDVYLLDMIDALRGLGWIVQPAPVPGVPVNALPDGPPAPGAPADPGTPIDGPNW